MTPADQTFEDIGKLILAVVVIAGAVAWFI